MNPYEHFTSWMKARRKELNLTQQALANRVGYSISTIRKIEIGLLRPSRAATEELALCLELSPAEIPHFIHLARSSLENVPRLSDLTGTSASSTPQMRRPPVPASPIIDRDRETAFVRSVVEHSPTRLFTLVGPPGIGKTRLALHLTSELGTLYGAAITFISLEALTDPRLMLPTIAHTLGYGTNAADIQSVIGDRPFLFILDNFEQILPAAADLAMLLAACPRLKIIVTSRVVLNLSGQQQIPVMPLSYPLLHPMPAWDRLVAYAAVRLFIACAQQTVPDFVLNAENGPYIGEICARLSGLPLAIEIVATQSNELAWKEMLPQLDGLVIQAQHKKADWPARQHTLWAAIDWSYRLLSIDEQRLFRRLSIWVGGCTLAAIESIGNESAQGELDVADQLSTLLDKSLLYYHIPSGDSEPRFMMLESIREFAWTQLGRSEEHGPLQASHAKYYLALAQTARQAFRTPEEHHWVDRLAQEHDNLRAALAWSKIHDPRMLMQLCSALVRFWFLQSHIDEGRTWLLAAFSHSALADDTLYADLHYGMGVLAYAQSDCEVSIEHLELCMGIRRRLNDLPGMLTCLNYLGNAASTLHQVDRSIRYYTEALELVDSGDNELMRSTLLLNIGTLYYYEADFDAARRYFTECLAIHAHIDNPLGYGLALNNLGLVNYHTDKYDEAATLFQQSHQIAINIDHEPFVAHVLTNLARIAIVRRDLDLAREQLLESTLLRERHKDRHALALALEGWAELARVEHEPAHAIRLMAMAHALFLDVGTTIPPLALQLRTTQEATLRPLISEADYRAALAGIGPQMPLHDIVAYAMSFATPHEPSPPTHPTTLRASTKQP